MTGYEKNRAEVLLPEAIETAKNVADITIRALKGRIEDIRELDEARRDGLTGLWIRKYWEKLVEPRIEQIQQYGPESPEGAPNAALLVFADTEDLHFINNQLGYILGDHAVSYSSGALISFADFMKGTSRSHDRRSDPARLAQGTREMDLLCRLGGDEFAGFFPIRVGLDNKLEDVAQLITSRFKDGAEWDETLMPLISWGHTFILPGETKTLPEYLDEADPKLHMTDEEISQREIRKQKRINTGKY